MHRTINFPKLAELFLYYIFSKHRLPLHVTSNQGSEFISRFTRSLASVLKMRLHFTLDYYLQADGQTERVNQMLKQYLYMYCNYQQSDWSCLLPLAEFAYNNTPSKTIDVSLFFTNKGYHPQLEIQDLQGATSKDVRNFANNLNTVHLELKKAIAGASNIIKDPQTREDHQPYLFQ